jgi:hypothetical protein
MSTTCTHADENTESSIANLDVMVKDEILDETKKLRQERKLEMNEMKGMFMIQGVIVMVGCSLDGIAIVM